MGFDEEEHLNICCNCMELIPEGESICPRCGFDNREQLNSGDVLPERTILAGKYLIGAVLGRGGFGITYLAYDLILRVKVAVKEYFPLGICTRDPKSWHIICPAQGSVYERFQKGRKAFQDEAQTLALFDSPFIVRVRDFFLENGTAYIIMEYVEGDSLNRRARKNGGTLPPDQVIDLFCPLIRELGNLHDKKLIHRDIKPENIKITPDKSSGTEHLVLLDFGAARSFISENVTQTYTAMVTQGFAPIEQYSQRSHQGPYTDVYSLCATMYAIMTGEKPPAAMDIMIGAATLKPFSDFGVTMPPAAESAILHGLALKSEDRTQDMRELYRELYESLPAPIHEIEAHGKADVQPAEDIQDRITEPTQILNEAETEKDPDVPNESESEEQASAGQSAESFTESPPLQAEIHPERSGKKKKSKVFPLLLALLAAGAIFFMLRPDTKDLTRIFTLPTARESKPTDEVLPTPFPEAEPTATKLSLLSSNLTRWKPGDVYAFGHYNSSEAIEWLVLTVEEGRALLVSRTALELRPYHGTHANVDWESSDVRKWLNGSFYSVAFTAAEKARILSVTDSGAEDRIFLLSAEEAQKYFPDDSSRRCKAAPFLDRKGTQPWWLRTPGESGSDAAYVSAEGAIITAGSPADNTAILVRPAFWMNTTIGIYQSYGGGY